MHRLLYYILILFLWFHSVPGILMAASSAQSTDTSGHIKLLPGNAERILLSKGVQYYFESEPLTHQQVSALTEEQWTTWPDDNLINFDTLDNAVWLRLQVRNMASGDDRWLLEFFWTFLNSIELFQYFPESGKWAAPMISGLVTSREQRPLPYRLFAFPVSLPQGETVQLFIRCYSNSKLLLPITFYSRNYYDKVEFFLVLLFSVYFGILLVMCCYNLSLYLFTEDKSYLFYSAYVFAVILYSLMSTGFGPFYLWDRVTWLKTYGYLPLSTLTLLTATLFVRQFLNLKKYGGWVYHCNTALVIYWILSALLYMAKPYSVWVKLEDLASLFASIIALVTAIYVWRRGELSARYFIVAWSFLILGTVALVLSCSGQIPFKHPVLYSQFIGVMIEVLLLSFALADRINREKAAREEAQQTALALSHKISRERQEKLEAQNRLLEIQHRTNEDLEDQVKERTLKLERAIASLEETHRELSEVSISDPLTRVHNRRYFDEFLATECQRAIRVSHPMALLMVDIDHFKIINDNHGHLVGDQCLRIVAQTIRQNAVRASDLVARYGGEEFALVLPAATPDNAVAVAERIREAVEKIDYTHQGQAVKMCVSIGVAGWVPLKETSVEQLIQVADEALYAAKKNGRNRVEAAVVAGEVIETTTTNRARV